MLKHDQIPIHEIQNAFIFNKPNHHADTHFSDRRIDLLCDLF